MKRRGTNHHSRCWLICFFFPSIAYCISPPCSNLHQVRQRGGDGIILLHAGALPQMHSPTLRVQQWGEKTLSCCPACEKAHCVPFFLLWCPIASFLVWYESTHEEIHNIFCLYANCVNAKCINITNNTNMSDGKNAAEWLIFLPVSFQSADPSSCLVTHLMRSCLWCDDGMLH